MTIIFDIVGATGVFLILSAYTLLQIEKITTKDISYHILNLIGAVLIILSLFSAWNFPAFMIETAWAFISAYGAMRCLHRTHQRKKGRKQ